MNKIILETNGAQDKFINVPDQIMLAIDTLLLKIIDNNFNMVVSSTKKEQKDNERL